METIEKEATSSSSSGEEETEPKDLGGLGGAAPLSSKAPEPPTLEERRLKKNIKYIVTKYPHVDINKFSELEHQLFGLKAPELRDILESVQSQAGGGLSPYASVESIIKMAGTTIERKTKKRGFAEILSKDPDLVSAVDELCPAMVHSLAAPIQIAWSLGKAWIEHDDLEAKHGSKQPENLEKQAPSVSEGEQKEKEVSQSGKESQEAQDPPTKKRKTTKGDLPIQSPPTGSTPH